MMDEVGKLREQIKQFGHDVRTPLSTIKNEVELIGIDLGEAQIAVIKKAFEKIQLLLVDFENSANGQVS